MSFQAGRFPQFQWLQTVVCVTGLLGAIFLVALAVLQVNLAEQRIWLFVAGGLIALIALFGLMTTRLLLKIESNLSRELGEIRDLSDAIKRQAAKLEAIAENTRISDAAKSLAHRAQEIDALRNAIRENTRMEQWDAALNLLDEMERRFGYKNEAARIREELVEARNATIESKLNEAIGMIERHFQKHDWPTAVSEIERLKQALPDDSRVSHLKDRLKELQEQHKHSLKAEWDEAVRRSDTDHAIDVLKELDQYLSSSEAQMLQSSARHVFKEKLLQLGIQFRFAVNERRWQDALNTGLELVREFPNARMATEVREVLDTLRERARAAMEGLPSGRH